MNKKKKNTVYLVAVVVLVALAAFLVWHNSGKGTVDQDYHVADVGSVTRIYISDKENNHVLLSRVEGFSTDSSWMVENQYLASYPVVELMLQTLHEMRIRQFVNKSAVPNVVKRIATSHVKVDVYQRVFRIDILGLHLFPHEKLTRTYFFGSETQDQMGSYVYRQGDKDPYVVHVPGFRGFLAPRFPTAVSAWRSHRIMAVDIKHLQRVELEIPASPQESYAVYREGDDFRMELTHPCRPVDGFDTARVAQLLSSFANLNFDEYAHAVPNAVFDSSLSQTPRAILRVTDNSGRTYEVKTYLKYNNPDDHKVMPDPEMYATFDIDRLYAVVDSRDTVLIQYFSFDNILQPASFFLGAAPTYFAR